jgi:outer membrane receptor protein involved in Fe transport
VSLFDRLASRIAAKRNASPAVICIPRIRQIRLFVIAGCLICAAPVQGADSDSESTPPAQSVGEVSVTATRAEREVLNTPGNVTVIDREQIERSGLSNVPELLRRQAGVFVSNTTSSPDGYGMELRGFDNGSGSGSGTLVLVDGRRINEPDSTNVDWSRLRLDDVERIEILRGPASAAWGDNAMGGVVQIFTRRGEGDTQATLKNRAGSYGKYGGSFYTGGSQGPVAASLFAEGLDSDNYRDRAEFWSAQVQGNVRLSLGEKLSMDVGGGYLEDERNRPGTLSEAEIATLGRRAADPDTVGDALKRERFHVDSLIEWTPRKDMLFTLRPYYQERDDDGQITVVTGVPPTYLVPRPVQFITDTKTETLGINPQGQIDHSWGWGKNRLIFGADILRDDIRVGDISVDTTDGTNPFAPGDKKSERRIYAGYVQEELELAKRVTLSAGLRFDSTKLAGRDLLDGRRFSTDNDFWSPKIAGVWRFHSDASVYLSYAKGFRLPNIDEAFGFFGFNEGLEPERSDNYEIGVKLRHEQIHFDLALYHLDVKDEILFNHEIDVDGFARGRSVNIDRVRHRGIEVSTRIFPWSWFMSFFPERLEAFFPGDWLEIYGSYTYEDNEIRRDAFTLGSGEIRPSLVGKRLPITPENRGNFGVNARLPYWVELGFEGKFTDSRYRANDLLNEFRKLPSFEVYDARVAFRPKIGEHVRFDLAFRANNLFNTKYTENGGERTFQRGEFGFYPSPRRNYLGTVSVTVTR